MDQQQLDGRKPERAWFGRVWGRVWPWSPMGWLWTILFFTLIVALIFKVNELEAVHDPSAEKWWLAFPVLIIVFLVVAYAKSKKV